MKKKQAARNRARVASAKELERDAKQQLAYLDRVKPRPPKMTAEEDREAQAQLDCLDANKALTNHFWDELTEHLTRGNVTTAHYLLTSPGYLGSFIPGGGPQPPESVKKNLARQKIRSRRALHKHLDDRLGEARGKVLVRVLQDLAGACLFGEMLALLPFAREALRQAGPDNTNAREAVALCRQALLHLPPDAGAHNNDADLITLRRDYNETLEPF